MENEMFCHTKVPFWLALLAILACSGCKASLDPSATATSYVRLLDTDPPQALACMRTASDGNLLFLYTAEVSGDSITSIELTKTDVNGNVVWTKHFGGTDDYEAGDCLSLSNGTVAVAGTHTLGNKANVVLLLLDPNGNVTLRKEFQPQYLISPVVSTLSQTDAGDFVISCFSKSSLNTSTGNQALGMLHVSSSGDSLGIATLPGNLLNNDQDKNDYLLHAISSISGGYALGVGSDVLGTYGYRVLYSWQSPDSVAYVGYLFPDVGGGTLRSIVRTGPSSYIIAGDSNDYTPTHHFPWIGEMDPPFSGGTLNPLWHRVITGDSNGSIMNIIQTADGGLAATGFSVTKAADTSILVFRFDAKGNDVWPYKMYSLAGGDFPYNIVELPNGDLIIGGVTTSFGSRASGARQIFLLHLKADGTPAS